MEGYGKRRDNVVPKFSHLKKQLMQLLSKDRIERDLKESLKEIIERYHIKSVSIL